MKIQELFLAAAEPSHIDNLRGVHAHSLERGMVSDRGNYERPVVLEANKPTIEEMINTRCQKQAVPSFPICGQSRKLSLLKTRF